MADALLTDEVKSDGAENPEAPSTLEALVLLLEGFSHLTRLRIVKALRKQDAVHSPKQLAAILGEPLGVVSYHVREMRNRGVLELVRTEPARGALQHFYRLSDEGHRVRKLLRL